MKKKKLWPLMAGGLLAVVTFIYTYHAYQNADDDEIDEYVQTSGETILIRPLKEDIRQSGKNFTLAKNQPRGADANGRRPASVALTPFSGKKGVVIRETIGGTTTISAPKPTKIDRATLYQAYRTTLLEMGKTSSEDQRNVQVVLDYIQTASEQELPDVNVSATGKNYRLASAIDVSKFKEPQIREVLRLLLGADSQPIDPKKAK